MSLHGIPRLSRPAVRNRWEQIKHHLEQGKDAAELVDVDAAGTTCHPTAGRRPSAALLSEWRDGVLESVELLDERGKAGRDVEALEIGRALSKVIDPCGVDVAASGSWAYLSLHMFPDLVHRRWGRTEDDEPLAVDRWLGTPYGRDRNYLKLSLTRWRILGEELLEFHPPLGEDEFGALLERTVVARNRRLIRSAARAIVDTPRPDHLSRSAFARELMKLVCRATGARLIDLLSDEDIEALVAGCGQRVISAQPRRAHHA